MFNHANDRGKELGAILGALLALGIFVSPSASASAATDISITVTDGDQAPVISTAAPEVSIAGQTSSDTIDTATGATGLDQHSPDDDVRCPGPSVDLENMNSNGAHGPVRDGPTHGDSLLHR
jgi:hypothetical protein